MNSYLWLNYSTQDTSINITLVLALAQGKTLAILSTNLLAYF